MNARVQSEFLIKIRELYSLDYKDIINIIYITPSCKVIFVVLSFAYTVRPFRISKIHLFIYFNLLQY